MTQCNSGAQDIPNFDSQLNTSRNVTAQTSTLRADAPAFDGITLSSKDTTRGANYGHLKSDVTAAPSYLNHPQGAAAANLKGIYERVTASGQYNFAKARIRVPSGLSVEAWRRYLVDYPDQGLVDFLEFGWPVNFDRRSQLIASGINHPSARQHQEDIAFYIATETRFGALAGPFRGPPVTVFHTSPLMSRPKKDSIHRRVIMDLSWPKGYAINDGIHPAVYIDGPARVTLPTSEYMVARLLELGQGAYMYKTDLARGYRQLRVDPWDWPLLGFQHDDLFYMDLCPPFGLKSSAMCMQRTTEAISYIHGKLGFYSRPYLDDFGGAEPDEARAIEALTTLQGVLRELGVNEATHKVCQPATRMTWLGIQYDSILMRMEIPPPKLMEIMEVVQSWEGRLRATQRDILSRSDMYLSRPHHCL